MNYSTSNPKPTFMDVREVPWLRGMLGTQFMPGPMLPYVDEPMPSALSAGDVRRIAVAVADELERRESSPLRVTADDRRRWGL